MRDLPEEVGEQSVALTAAPALVLELICAGQTLRYTDSACALPFATDGRLTVAGALRFRFDAFGVLGDEELTLRIHDDAGAAAALLAEEGFADAPVRLLQCFENLPLELAVVLFRGVLRDAPVWLEESRELELAPAGMLGAWMSQQLLRPAAREVFPHLAPEDEGEYLPFCSGSPARVPGVCVARSAQGVLTSTLSASAHEFYVLDAGAFAQDTPLLLKIGDEYLTGTFSGNRCVVGARADFYINAFFGEPAGNASLARVRNLDAATLARLPGQTLAATVDGVAQTRQILGVTAEGLLRLEYPFRSRVGTFRTADEGAACVLKSVASWHNAGETIRLADDEQIFVVADGAGAELVLLEGQTEDGFAAVPTTRYSYTACDATTFAQAGRELALIRLPLPLTALPQSPFIDDRVYATFRGDSTNPAHLLRQVLTQRLGFAEDDLDAQSFERAAEARADTVMSFALAESMRVEAFLQDFCLQARLALMAEGGRIRLLPLENGLNTQSADPDGGAGVSADAAGAAELTLPAARIRAGSLRVSPGAGARTLAVRGAYRGGKVSARTAQTALGGGVEDEACVRERVLPLWAFESEWQARRAAEWWLARLNRVWRQVELQTFLPGLALERLDVVQAEAQLPGQQEAVRGRVVELQRLGRTEAEQIDAYRVVLDCPQWSGCLSACETSCEAAGCESASCELSCTTGCELTCQVACENAGQAYGLASEKGCSTSCQVNCRSSEEKACSSGCESSCEFGCEISCEGESYEIVCPTGCESAQEQTTVSETVRRIRVVSSPAMPGGALTAMNLEASGGTFVVYDVADLRPQAGSEGTALLLANGAWGLASAGREAKFVRVVAALGGGAYTVIETDAGGADWGESFSAAYPA